VPKGAPTWSARFETVASRARVLHTNCQAEHKMAFKPSRIEVITKPSLDQRTQRVDQE
jgi:hypothetical protein